MEYLLVALWLLVYAGLAVLGYPLAARLFRRFETRGIGFALPVALVTVWLPVYWLGRLHFGPLTVLVGLLVLVGVAAALGLDREALRDRRLELAPDLAADLPDREVVRDTAAVFAVAFLVVVAVRAVDPSVHAVAGEKYLDYGLLKSLALSPQLPPEDMWFAGEPVNYYYGGHLLAAILTVLTGTATRFAYNLALAGFYAMLVTAAFDLARTVAADRVGADGDGADRTADEGDLDGRTAGFFAAFFVGVASNLETAGKVVVGLLPAGMRGRFVREGAQVPFYELAPESFRQFYYWWASRVIPGTINEFPLFAWLNGDLHAHMMGTPFLLLAAALGYALYRAPAEATRHRRGLLGAVALLGSFQIVTDTWSFPSVFGVTFLALTFAPAGPVTLLPDAWADRVRALGGDSRAAEEVRRPLLALGAVAVAGVVAVVLGIPFFTGAGASRSISLLGPENRSGLGELLVVHGAFVALFLVYLFARTLAGRGEAGADGAADRRTRLALLLALVAVGWAAVSQGMAVVAVAAPLFVLGWVCLRLDRPVGYETVLILAGTGLVTLVEFVYVVEQAGPLRMNTVFKTYMQVWVLWGTAAGVVAASVLRRPRFLPALSPERRRAVASVFLALVVVSTGLYGALAMADHFGRHSGPATLDATTFGPQYDDQEVAAVEWLDARTTPDTTLLSAPATGWYPAKGTGGHPPGMYAWNSAIAASLTGAPTVAGWGHEVGYRGAEAYYARVKQVDAAYTGSPAQTAAVLRQYDVEYVWVGTAERARYGDAMTDFRSMQGLEVVFENDAVTVYRVHESQLPG